MDPKLSILLATKNRARYLARFFANIEEQMKSCGCSSELIVIDGGSTDGAVDVIKSHEHLISYWISEPDTGVSEAVNKGLRRVRGTIVKLVADDDLFFRGAFKKGVDYLDRHPDVDCVIYGENWFVESDTGERVGSYGSGRSAGEITLESLLQFPYSGMIFPEAAFYRTASMTAVDGYDESLHPWAYWDLWLRQAKAGCRIVYVPEIRMEKLSTPLSDGCKMQFEQKQRWMNEFNEVVARNGNVYWRLWHKFGGEISAISILKFCLRSVCVSVFGLTPRQLLGQRPR